MTNITIPYTYADELLPVYCEYLYQNQPQRAHIYMDENGEVWAGYNTSIGNNAVTFDEHHLRTLVWDIPCNITGEALDELLERIEPLLERVHEGHSIEWDGNNMTGQLDGDATAASEEIEKAIAALTDKDILALQEAAIWDSNRIMTADVRADMTDAEVEAVAESLHMQILDEDQIYLLDLPEYLFQLRDDLQEAAGS